MCREINISNALFVHELVVFQVTVLVGDPIELDDLVKQNTAEGVSKAALYDAIALRVGQRMSSMKEELDQLVAARNLQEARECAQIQHTVERAQGLLQYLDWEAQGLVPETDSIVTEEFITLTPASSSQQETVAGLTPLSSGKTPKYGFVFAVFAALFLF